MPVLYLAADCPMPQRTAGRAGNPTLGGRKFLGALRQQPLGSPVLFPWDALYSKGSREICSHEMFHPVSMKKEPSCYNG